MNAKRSVLFAAMAALPLAVASANAQAQSYEMVIATQLPEDMSNNEIYPALVHFKNLVEARTDGDLEVTIFGGGQLGSEVENGSEVQGGRTLQSTIMSAGAMSSFYEDYQVVTAPFLFTNWRQAWSFFDSEWFADFMSGTVEAADMRYLGTFDDGGGFVAFTNNVRFRDATSLGRANHRAGNRLGRWSVQRAGAQHHLQLRRSHRLHHAHWACV